MNKNIYDLKKLIDQQQKILVLTGAGIQTDSGIPDYRGLNGIYSGCEEPARILSTEFFDEHTKEFYDFFLNKMVYPDAEENSGHKWVKHLEDLGKKVVVITQNIDGLHTKAGSSKVYEIHGNSSRYRCIYCEQRFNTNIKDARWPKRDGIIPICPFCKHILKPDVVLYGEPIELPKNVNLEQLVQRCDLVIIMGTQLQVQPANDVPMMASNRGIPVYAVNLTDYTDNEKLKNVRFVLIQEKIQKFVEEIENGNSMYHGKGSDI